MQREPKKIGLTLRTMAGAVCLLLSGAGALFYELVWSHQFSIVFGSSEIATASVLGIYLAGLGFGAPWVVFAVLSLFVYGFGYEDLAMGRWYNSLAITLGIGSFVGGIVYYVRRIEP